MRAIFEDRDIPRDEHGRILLGDRNAGCRWCGAEPVATVSACNRVVWWHPPTKCCTGRRHAQIMADRAAASDSVQEAVLS